MKIAYKETTYDEITFQVWMIQRWEKGIELHRESNSELPFTEWMREKYELKLRVLEK